MANVGRIMAMEQRRHMLQSNKNGTAQMVTRPYALRRGRKLTFGAGNREMAGMWL
ncbi:hypothetical protein GCM10010970_30050 [Silvimonas iriomotensis]|uniref:Uncharacterized protein n=1 Tax=Silvimonas iriomotensis TaxID=449662 RepID=A0ABQ2PCM8_9NEIS|nr:hypothetical protein GCM10010970_30050 [Silvimonas iriomotensis]